ncbi:MAG: hypothetical protein L3J82_10315 [Planctomycetes bacterium]|nr:hypothetical protein [Planctomycetota bacterium]
MAKKPFPGAAPGGPSAAQSEAVGKFDKFGTFALALPVTILAVVALFVADGYTMSHLGWSFVRTPTRVSYDSVNMQGTDGIISSKPATVIGFSQENYIGRSSEGEVDAAELSVGYNNGVRLGDVFTLKKDTDGVRLEFIVFDVQGSTSRAYILLGQNLSGDAKRKYSLKRTSLVDLCGKENGIEIKRLWADQQIRRHTEVRSEGQ